MIKGSHQAELCGTGEALDHLVPLAVAIMLPVTWVCDVPLQGPVLPCSAL